MNFWYRLKNEIKAQNTTQEWIAGKIGVPLSTFRKWMSRKTYPNIREGVEIARLLETTAEYLVTGYFTKNLSEEEQQLIGSYRKLKETDKINILLAIKAWLRNY